MVYTLLSIIVCCLRILVCRLLSITYYGVYVTELRCTAHTHVIWSAVYVSQYYGVSGAEWCIRYSVAVHHTNGVYITHDEMNSDILHVIYDVLFWCMRYSDAA